MSAGRLGLLVAVAVVAAIAGIAAVSSAARTPQSLTLICALKGNGLVKVVTSASQCPPKQGTLLTFSVASPVTLCRQPDGSVRQVPLRDCTKASGTMFTVPSNTPAYFCVNLSTGGALRYVSDPSLCASGETPFFRHQPRADGHRADRCERRREQARPNDRRDVHRHRPRRGRQPRLRARIGRRRHGQRVVHGRRRRAEDCGVVRLRDAELLLDPRAGQRPPRPDVRGDLHDHGHGRGRGSRSSRRAPARRRTPRTLAAVAVDGALTVSDPDSANLAGARRAHLRRLRDR